MESQTTRGTTPTNPQRPANGESKAPAAQRRAKYDRVLEHLPGWLQEALVTSRPWKYWVRSMIAAFAMMIMMVARKSEWTWRRESG